MTNVDFFREFAALVVENVKPAYFFEHGRQSRVDANLFDEDDNRIKMFHYTREFVERANQVGTVLGVEYRGTIYTVVKSDLDDLVDKEIIEDDEPVKDGKYDKHVKPLINGGSLFKLIRSFNNCTYDYELTFTRIVEIYNFLDYNADGIAFDYTLFIPNDR
jgi:(2Fe-2S) ferredoxin